MPQYADARRIPASPTELQKLAERITAANHAKQASDHAAAVATDMFTIFCEAHGVPGATFVGIADGQVIVSLPEQEVPKPELVKDA